MGLVCVIACSSSPQAVVDGGPPSKDAPAEAASCDGLDAAASGLTFPKSCEACIGQSCCSLALACAKVPACKVIEECEAKCVTTTTMGGLNCATACIAPDGGDTTNLSAAQQAAESLDVCIGGSCSTFCGGG